MANTTLAEFIAGRPIHTTTPDESVRLACILMSSKNIGALPVVNDAGELVGMLSERDVIRRSVIVYRPSEETNVSQIMTENPKWLPPDAEPEQAVEMMIDGGFRHLPICVDSKVVGVVSIRDFEMEKITIIKQS